MAVKIGDLTLFDVMELSKKFSVNPVTVRGYMRSGKLKGRKIGRKWYLTEEALRDYFNLPGPEKAGETGKAGKQGYGRPGPLEKRAPTSNKGARFPGGRRKDEK